MAKVKTQWKDILEHLQEQGHITSMEAWSQYHITRLAAVIFKLRKMGYNITTYDCVGRNEYGVYNYADYRLEGMSDEAVSNL